MEHQQAITIIKDMLEKRQLTEQEKEALMTAMGMLSWAALSKSYIRNQKSKKEKNTEW